MVEFQAEDALTGTLHLVMGTLCGYWDVIVIYLGQAAYRPYWYVVDVIYLFSIINGYKF